MPAEPKQKGFAGKFYPQELINSGGMSEIWLVTDGRGKPYALRKLKKELRFNLLARRRFFRGCEVLSKLNESEFIVGYIESTARPKARLICSWIMSRRRTSRSCLRSRIRS